MKLTFLSFFLFLFSKSFGQTVQDSTKHWKDPFIWVTVGYGGADRESVEKLELELRQGKGLYTAAFHDLHKEEFLNEDHRHLNQNYSLMYGRFLSFKRTLISLSSGLGLVKVFNDTSNPTYYLGLPIKIQIIYAYRFVGIGFNISGNVNKNENYISWGVSLSLGKIN